MGGRLVCSGKKGGAALQLIPRHSSGAPHLYLPVSSLGHLVPISGRDLACPFCASAAQYWRLQTGQVALLFF